MDNPLILNKRYFLYYLLAWLSVALIHIAALNMVAGVRIVIAVTDGLIFNTSFAFLGLSSWFMVRFMQAGSRKLISLFFNYLVVAVLISIIWVSLCSYILSRIFLLDTEYQSILNDGLYGRFVAGLFFYLLIILIYYLITYYNNIQEKINSEIRLNAMVQEAKLDVLKSQMNPHFIFNSLNSVTSLIITSPEKARDMVIKLASFLRYSLEQDSRSTSSIKEELINIDNYLSIEKIRFGERLEYYNNIDDECLSCTLPALILQPLFENAIKHGVYQSIGVIKINLTIIKANNLIQLVLKNNFDPEPGKARNKGGIGLANIRNRLKLLYNRSDLLAVHEKDNIFEVTLYIPQKQV